MAKGRFGGDAYKPRQLGPEPSSPAPVGVSPSSVLSVAGASEPNSVAEVSEPERTTVTTSAAVEASAAPVHRREPVAGPSELEMLRSLRVPFSSRITAAADRQLKALSREGQGRSQTDLLAEALNLLFKKHGRDQVA